MTPQPQAGFPAAGFRLFEDGATFPPDRLHAAAPGVDTLAATWGTAVWCPAGASVHTLLAALLAARQRALPLLLARPGVTAPPQTPPPQPGFVVALATSGTTGPAGWIWHDWARLKGRIRLTPAPACWLLSYTPASFAGLQVILTAALSGVDLVASGSAETATVRIQALLRPPPGRAITHASGTPSFWRTVLLALPRPVADSRLRSLTLGGEIADAATLERLAAAFPAARICHLYASTEAGALFAVHDGRAGFPARWLETGVDEVLLRIRNDILEVRSPRGMLKADRRGAPPDPEPATDRLHADGWLITGDQVRREGDRIVFAGRADTQVNIGGVKICPETVEAALLAVPGVAEAWVCAHASPLTGHVLTAQVVPAPGQEPEALRPALRQGLAALPAAARPRKIVFTAALPETLSGKKQRRT